MGTELAERGGKSAKKRAVARKLAVLLHRLWVTGAVYEPKGAAPCYIPVNGSLRSAAKEVSQAHTEICRQHGSVKYGALTFRKFAGCESPRRANIRWTNPVLESEPFIKTCHLLRRRESIW